MENKFLDAMMFRHACKGFDEKKKISDEDFNAILEMGRLSPSSFGVEPWKFVVVQNEDLREKMREFSWGALDKLSNTSHFVLILARKKKGTIYSSEYIDYMLKDVKQMPEDVIKMYKGFYEKFQKEDFNILESEKAMSDWASKQTYIALANMMTGAAYMGIDSCPIEGFDIQKADEFLEKELNIDTSEFGISVMAAFGYRETQPREKSRLQMDEIVSWYN